MRKILLSAVMAALAGACGGDSTGPGPTYESVAGNYGGVMTGLSQGVSLDGMFSITLTQEDGSLAGSYSIAGTLTDGSGQLIFEGTGALTGSIASGSNPSVNVVATPSLCPANTATFSGTYDSANRRITLQGPVQFFGGDCSVVLVYATTIVLTR